MHTIKQTLEATITHCELVFSSTILLRLKLKGNSLFLLFNKICSVFFFFSRLFADLCMCQRLFCMSNYDEFFNNLTAYNDYRHGFTEFRI